MTWQTQMPTTPPDLVEFATRHQVYLEGLKTGEANKAADFLKKLNKEISGRLAGRDLTKYSRSRLDRLLKSVKADLKVLAGEFTDIVAKDAIDLAKYERDFEIKSLDKVAVYEWAVPTVAQLRSAVFNNPLTIAGAGQGELLKPFIRDLTSRQLNEIAGAINAGYYEGASTNQILQNIRGTRAAKFRDGILARTNRNAQTIVRTALQHSAQQARQEVWNNNSDIVKRVRWVSTLDSRTSAQCRTLDGRTFPIDKGPRPPIHINCRSTTVAVLDDRFDFLREGAKRAARDPATGQIKRVDSNETYYGWLKKQPKSFQESVLGKSRTELLRKGNLSSERFAQLQLNKNFEPLTLDEMKALEPAAFERAGLDQLTIMY